MTTGLETAKLGDLIQPAQTWNPLRSDAERVFDYIDLSAVDQDQKLITEARQISCAEAPSRARQIVQHGDVLVSTVRPNLNGVARVTKSLDGATASTGFCVLRAKASELDGSYLFHWVKSPVFVADMVKKATGASYPAVSDRIIFESPIPLPPLAEQRRIAEVLDKAEALRAKRRAALAQLDSLTQSLFLDLFGDPATNPKRWPLSSLADVCSISGQYGSGVPAIEFSQSRPRYVRITDIDAEGKLAAERVSPGGTSADWSDLKLETGDVVFARSGATVGKTYMYSPDDGDCVFAGYLIRFRTLPTKLLPEFLFHFTRSTAYLRWVLARQRVVAQPNINAKQYGTELSLPLPPMALQREFARRVAAVEKLKTAQRAALAELDSLFASLQHRAFRGEL